MRKIKKEKGITLIALVITIIVLLILAGISIATLTGENGILTKATTSKTESVKGQETEQIKLAYSATLTDKLEKSDNTAITAEELKVELVKLEPDVTVAGSDAIIVTSNKSKNEYIVDSKGNVRENKMIHFTLDGQEFSCSEGETWLSFARTGGLEGRPYAFGHYYLGAEEERSLFYLIWVDEDTFTGHANELEASIVVLGENKVKETDKIIEGASYFRSEESNSNINAGDFYNGNWMKGQE